MQYKQTKANDMKASHNQVIAQCCATCAFYSKDPVGYGQDEDEYCNRLADDGYVFPVAADGGCTWGVPDPNIDATNTEELY